MTVLLNTSLKDPLHSPSAAAGIYGKILFFDFMLIFEKFRLFFMSEPIFSTFVIYSLWISSLLLLTPFPTFLQFLVVKMDYFSSN